MSRGVEPRQDGRSGSRRRVHIGRRGAHAVVANQSVAQQPGRDDPVQFGGIDALQDPADRGLTRRPAAQPEPGPHCRVRSRAHSEIAM